MAQNGLPTLHVDPNLLARELDTSLSLANRSPTGPDDEALLRDASKRLGIPLDTARSNPQETKRAVESSAVDLADYARRFPSTAHYLANPDNALVSRDDLGPLSEVEQTLRAAIRQSMLADVGVGVNAGQAIVEKLTPGYSAEVALEREVLRTQGFAAAAKLRREHQLRREAELARNTGFAAPIQQPEPTLGNILSGLASGTASAFRSQALGLQQQFGDIFDDPDTPEARARTERYNRARAQEDFRASLKRPEFDYWLSDAAYGGFESLAQTLPALTLSIGTGSPVPGLLAMGTQTYGEAYGRYRGRGAERGAASMGASGEAAVEVLTEILPMKFAVDRFGKAGLGDFLTGLLAREVPGEQIATLVQDAIDTAIANPDKTWAEYWAERPDAAGRTLIATLVQSGTVAAVGEGAGRLAGTLDRKRDEIDEAHAAAQQLQQLLAAAGRSATRQRTPATFSQLVQEAAEDGGAPTELFIDARTLIAALEQEGLSREQLEQALPSVAEQIEIAAALESDIVIPIGEATAALAGTGLEAALAQNARTREDALSMAEADALDAELLQQLEVEAARVMEEQTDKQAWENDAREVFDTLTAELGNAGRFSPDVNRAYASLLRNFYATTASRLGTTPSELYARFPLQVSSRAPGARTNVLDQYASSVTTGARPGELTVEGVHFSAGRREVLDGSFYGTGARGAESARLADLPADSPLRRRVYAYVDEGAGVRPEQGVGSTAHAVTLQNIYDTGRDPLGIWTGDANTREQAVLDAGFDGYYVPGSMAAGQGRTQGTVVTLGDAAQAIPAREYAPGGVSAAQEQLSPERQALEELYNDNRIPSGMMTPRRLGERVQRMRPDLYEILEPTGLFEGETEAYKADIIAAAARDADLFAQSLSTRLPTAVKAAEDPLNAVLNITFDVALSDTKTLTKNMAALSATPNMRKLTGRGAKDPVRQAEAFIEHVKGNLLWLHDHMPQEWRERAKLWYDGGRKTIDLWSRRYGTSQMQGAAVIAVMSPQNGWFANVSQAERVMDLVFGARDVRWDDAMTAEAERISGEGGPDANMQAAMGKTLGELLDTPEVAARWIRVYDQTHNNRAYRVLTPEGGAADYVKTGAGNDATMMWKSYATIAKAVSVLVDGRAENVHYQLGKEHKVRNFYNNLLEPHSELGFATIDTHAVAAAMLRPLASSDTEVLQAFGGTGAASSSVTGLRGTYPIYLEAYRRAAEERGIQAREMQSITWEAVRGLFEAAKKAGLKKKANAIWERYKSGEIEQEQAQQEILELAGDITPPDWTAVEFNDQPGRTYEGPIQQVIDERGEVGAQGNDTTVVFEVAPDPNDAELTARWNALDDADRLRLSVAVAQETVPKVLKEFSTDGEFSVQLGGYLGATNPSLTLRLEHPELAVQIAKAMGHILSQDSMVVVSPAAIAGTDPVGSVTLSLPEGMGAAEVAELYDRLWALEDNGEKLVGGHTTADGQMAILNFTGLDTAELARRIDEHLGGAFEVAIDGVFAAFPQREDYGYGSDRSEGETAPAQSSVQKRIDNIRTEAGQLLEASLAELDGRTAAQPGQQQQQQQEVAAAAAAAAADPADPNLLNQRSGARATFNPASLEIALLEKADLSSFLHETGHFFFEMLGTLAAEPGAPQSLRDDMQLLLDHIGFKGTIEEWVKLSVNERREGHETIAETFEQYLFTGKAPTAEMQSLFRRFKSWLIAVYRSLQDFLDGNERASLTPEVRGVFDRLIATEEEIKAAQAVREFQPLFEEQGAMPQEEWEAYQLSIEQHQAEALESLQSRALRDMKWLDNAKSRKLRELQREADARRKGLRDEVTAEIEAEPVYAAMEFLKHGRLQADGEEIQIAENRAHKLNIDAVEALFPEGDLGQPVDWKKLGYGKYGMLSKDGLPPDVVAEMFGFKSGRDLVTSLLNAEPKAAAINGLTDQRMLERYGDLSSPAAMREAANEALANEARARMVATELKAVAQLTGSPGVLARAARATAERIVAARKVRNLRPDLAAAAANRARKAAERAMASGDTAAAAAAKRTEMLNVQLERAERAAQKEHDKALRSFQKINKGTNEKIAKSRDVDLVNAARAVLARYGLAPRGAAVNAQNYMELLSTYNGAMAEDLRSMLQGLPPTMDFRELTVEQFNGMRDIVNGLYYLSKRTKQMEIDGEKVEIDAVADEIVAGVLDHTGGELPPLPGYTNTTTRADEWKVGLLGAKASLMRVEAWADAMGAPFKKYIWQPVSEAITRAKVRRNDMVKQYLDLLRGIERGLTYDKINAPELGSAGFTFNKGKTELLHAVLHTGNESNLRKLLLGRGWGTLREDGSLDTSRWDAFMARMYSEGTITKADMDFVQGVWDLLETVKTDAQRAHKEMYGYYFSEITANPVQTPWGEYRGGYVPAIADTLSSPDAAQKREQEELLHSGNSFMFPTTGKGFTQSRVEYNRPLALDLRSIGMHLDKVARFAYIEPAVRDVGKLLTNRRVARALNGYDQTLISSMLNPWLQRSARQNVNAPGKNPKVDKFFNELRTRSGMVLMFGNIVNTLQQFTGFSLAAVKVPAHRLLRANARYIYNHFEVVENARTLSPWLADRMDNHSFEMMGQIDKILLDPNPVKHAAEYLRRNAYFMQQGVQNVMDIIVWTGAYDHAVAQGASQKDAVRYADETVRLTQGSFAPEDVSAFEVQSPFVRLFTQFYGYFNMWGNLLGAEGKKALKDAGFVKASPRLMFLWFVGMAIPAFVAELIAAGAPDEEDDEDGDGLLDEWLAMFFGAQAKSVAAMVPVAGQISVLGANYMDDKVYNDRLNISPAVSLIESAVYGGTAALSGELFDEDLTKKEMRSALILTGMTFGVPVGPLMRAGGYAIDEAEGRKDADNALEYGAGLLLGR